MGQPSGAGLTHFSSLILLNAPAVGVGHFPPPPGYTAGASMGINGGRWMVVGGVVPEKSGNKRPSPMVLGFTRSGTTIGGRLAVLRKKSIPHKMNTMAKLLD